MTDRKVMQQALDALTESVDLVTNEYVEAVELYSGYPSRLHRLTALKTALDAHNAAIDSLVRAIAQPEQPALKIGGKYNWVGQADRLVYLGKAGNWHQFKKIGDPREVWCEVLTQDLPSIEETAQPKDKP